MPVPVTAIYAVLLAIIALVLQQLVGRERLRAGVSINDGGDAALAVAMRRQANFVEQVPMILILFVVIELNGAPAWWIHALGVPLVFARSVHPFGLEFENSQVLARLVGAVATLLVAIAAIGMAGYLVLAG